MENISIVHFDGHIKRLEAFRPEELPLKEILVANSTYSRSSLKKRLINNGTLENKCSLCGLLGLWNGKPIKMILDHVNGVNDDHRQHNLRMVCPNCNSQLDTFAGRNYKVRSKRVNCLLCGKKVFKKSRHCRRCSSKVRFIAGLDRKVQWPSFHELSREIEELGNCGVARRLGVSETAVRKMLKRLNTAEQEVFISQGEKCMIPDQPMVGSKTLNL